MLLGSSAFAVMDKELRLSVREASAGALGFDSFAFCLHFSGDDGSADSEQAFVLVSDSWVKPICGAPASNPRNRTVIHSVFLECLRKSETNFIALS